ncbi:MAG: phage holin family protein [Alphaproteobacteria bacterium]|nr:MAG: phage holin family protein [Alphaproteobacteria bacterium]
MTQIGEDVRSISRLFGDALENLSKLLRTEIQLARAEISEKASQAAVGAGMLVGALFLLTPALVLFLIAFAIWLTQLGLSPVTAHFIAGCLALLASAALALVGAARLKPSALTPQVTIREVKQDIAAAKEMTS